jgi:magnesium transporter
MVTTGPSRPSHSDAGAAPSAPPTETPPTATGGEAPVPAPPADRPVLMGYAWTAGTLVELASVDDIRAAHADPKARMWIDLTDPSHDVVGEISRCLGIHHLIAEDIVERNQRAKIEAFGELLHLVMYGLLYEGELISVELDIVLGKRFLLTAHEAGWDPVRAPVLRVEGAGRYLAQGTDYLLWALTDALVDSYFPVFDRIGDEIDTLQEDVLRRPSSWLVERLFQVRRDLLTIRRAVMPQREIFNQLTNRDMKLIDPSRIVYFRDVYDHLIRLTDELDSFREMVGTTLDAYLSTVNNNLSEIMKRLTAVTAVLAGIGALAGIFGMSEAGLALSVVDARFWILTAIIALVGLLGFAYFRRIGWI